MADKSTYINGFYAITEILFEELKKNKYVNTVTMGDLFDVDLNKQTIFPLAHIIVTNATLTGNHWVFEFDLLCMDWVEETKNFYDEQADSTDKLAPPIITDEMVFEGLDNTQNVLAEQLIVINRVIEMFRRGDYIKQGTLFELLGDPSCQPFMDRFENKLAGWVCSFSIQTPNNMTIC